MEIDALKGPPAIPQLPKLDMVALQKWLNDTATHLEKVWWDGWWRGCITCGVIVLGFVVFYLFMHRDK